jgi:kynurenine formamidase
VALIAFGVAVARCSENGKQGCKGGVAHYPEWSLPAPEYLYEQRKITASGHETTDTDPGIATTQDDYSLETYILSTNHYQIEVADEFRSGSGGGRYCRSQFSETKERLGVSSARICNRAVSCFGELTKSRGRNEGRR